MASENPLWGTERIRGELLKLGLVVSARSIRRYRRPRTARPPSQAWRTFLRNELARIWAADLFVVQTLTFKTSTCCSLSSTSVASWSIST
jgi:putative transposase